MTKMFLDLVTDKYMDSKNLARSNEKYEENYTKVHLSQTVKF